MECQQQNRICCLASIVIKLHSFTAVMFLLMESFDGSDPNALDASSCAGTYSYGTGCGLRIVFNEAELSQYTYEQSGLNLSFSALYDGLMAGSGA